MQLRETLIAAGMTPPRSLTPGRWMRFPGCGKGRANKSGWCRVISSGLALYGDWSTGLSEIWRDTSRRENAADRQALIEALRREREFAKRQAEDHARVATDAKRLIERAELATHPYLERKGFPTRRALVHDGMLVVPMRDAYHYGEIINCQLIAADGKKRFLTGGRAKGAVLKLGAAPSRLTTVVLCEGYATGLTLQDALGRLVSQAQVVVCFSSINLQKVADAFPNAFVAADNDESGTGERAAKATGLEYAMPEVVGEDWNDVSMRCGLLSVVRSLRGEVLT